MARRAAALAISAICACTAGGPASVPPPPPPPQAVEARPDPCRETRAVEARAPALIDAGRIDRAARVLRRAIDRCPSAATRLRPLLVRALALADRRADARAEIAAIEADPLATEPMKRDAVAERARLDAPSRPAPSPNDIARSLAEGDVALAEGVASSSRSKLDQALASYLAAIGGDAPDGDALHGAARAQRALGNESAAQAYLDRAVRAFEARAGAAAHADAATEIREPIWSPAWSHGAARLATAGAHAVTVFDLRTMREHGRIPSWAREVAFAGEDSGFLLAAREEGVEVIEARTLRRLRTLGGPCIPMAGSPRAPVVACGAPDGTVSLRDLENSREIGVLRDLGGAPRDLRFTDGGKTIVVLTAQAVTAWDAERGKLRRKLAARRGLELTQILPLRDGKSLAIIQTKVGELATDADRVDARTLGARGRIPIPKADEERAGGPPPNGVTEPGTWSSDGRFYLGASLWDRSGARLPLLGPHARAVLSAGFAGDGKVLGAGYEGGAFRSFDAATGHIRKTYLQTWETRAIAFRVDRGEYVARVASSPRTAWSADGRVEVRAHKQTVLVRNARDEKVCEGEGGTDEILVVAAAPDGGELVTLSATEALFWDAARCAVKAALPTVPGSRPTAAAFTPDGDSVGIAWRGARDELRIVDLASRTDRLIGAVGAGHQPRRVFFLGGGRSIALADPFLLWETESAKPLDHGAVRGSVLAISPNGKLAVTAESDDGALRFWSIPAGQLLAGVRALGDGGSAYAFVEGAAPADTRVDPADDRARDLLVCRIGPRAHTFDLCAERSEVPGLFAKAIAGDRSFLDP